MPKAPASSVKFKRIDPSGASSVPFKTKVQDPLPFIAEKLQSTSPSNRIEACVVLESTDMSPEMASRFLSSPPSKPVASLLLNCISHPSHSVKKAAAEALGTICASTPYRTASMPLLSASILVINNNGIDIITKAISSILSEVSYDLTYIQKHKDGETFENYQKIESESPISILSSLCRCLHAILSYSAQNDGKGTKKIFRKAVTSVIGNHEFRESICVALCNLLPIYTKNIPSEKIHTIINAPNVVLAKYLSDILSLNCVLVKMISLFLSLSSTVFSFPSESEKHRQSREHELLSSLFSSTTSPMVLRSLSMLALGFDSSNLCVSSIGMVKKIQDQCVNRIPIWEDTIQGMIDESGGSEFESKGKRGEVDKVEREIIVTKSKNEILSMLHLGEREQRCIIRLCNLLDVQQERMRSIKYATKAVKKMKGKATDIQDGEEEEEGDISVPESLLSLPLPSLVTLMKQQRTRLIHCSLVLNLITNELDVTHKAFSVIVNGIGQTLELIYGTSMQYEEGEEGEEGEESRGVIDGSDMPSPSVSTSLLSLLIALLSSLASSLPLRVLSSYSESKEDVHRRSVLSCTVSQCMRAIFLCEIEREEKKEKKNRIGENSLEFFKKVVPVLKLFLEQCATSLEEECELLPDIAPACGEILTLSSSFCDIFSLPLDQMAPLLPLIPPLLSLFPTLLKTFSDPSLPPFASRIIQPSLSLLRCIAISVNSVHPDTHTADKLTGDEEKAIECVTAGVQGVLEWLVDPDIVDGFDQKISRDQTMKRVKKSHKRCGVFHGQVDLVNECCELIIHGLSEKIASKSRDRYEICVLVEKLIQLMEENILIDERFSELVDTMIQWIEYVKHE
ncbi:hypothetical protein ADUPG1_009250 [Aduncisulcus paluster]|uniref:ARM repeat superfamily protein n=1 Tax=Aduncisulcus paluster TaxID=2918883 RepID=A0ABQ5KXU4_9EUKA|nr:hypothetical protein ADUPG1_009250 [Aduncisulcus paluster]